MDALRVAGVERVFSEKGSSVGPRPELRRALSSLSHGDVLVVWKLDRLSRGLKDLLDLLDQLKLSGCGFKSLTEPIDTTNPLGVFMLQILGAVAQLERSLIRQRVLAGQVSAYQRGVRWGGSARKLDDSQVAELRRLRADGFTIMELAELFGLGRSTVFDYVNVRRVSKRERMPVLGPLVDCGAGVSGRSL
ncbi:recombinase family protein [Variovorax sp. PAMC26660]|uniref:recombinase family protein n=1 Tax=Variovorax sp. PAMC26660 TaxID=2762322 RepID=UPI00164E66BD|nr:recombinase family protein [Variovorax sp. PAMC26660]QNK67842.1 recombinase family protein [Variovorax sp. PAMC26660]